MSRLIEIQPAAPDLPTELVIRVGDVLRFAASGGRVRDGSVVELLGIFVESALGSQGVVVAPQGPPNMVLFRANAPGQARIDVFTGDPWRSPSPRCLAITVL